MKLYQYDICYRQDVTEKPRSRYFFDTFTICANLHAFLRYGGGQISEVADTF